MQPTIALAMVWPAAISRISMKWVRAPRKVMACGAMRIWPVVCANGTVILSAITSRPVLIVLLLVRVHQNACTAVGVGVAMRPSCCPPPVSSANRGGEATTSGPGAQGHHSPLCRLDRSRIRHRVPCPLSSPCDAFTASSAASIARRRSTTSVVRDRRASRTPEHPVAPAARYRLHVLAGP